MPALGYDRDSKPQLVSVYLAARSRKCQLLELCSRLCQGWLTGPPTCSHSFFHPASIHHPLLWARHGAGLWGCSSGRGGHRLWPCGRELRSWGMWTVDRKCAPVIRYRAFSAVQTNRAGQGLGSQGGRLLAQPPAGPLVLSAGGRGF